MISISSLNSPELSQSGINNLQSCKSMISNLNNVAYEFVSNIKENTFNKNDLRIVDTDLKRSNLS